MEVANNTFMVVYLVLSSSWSHHSCCRFALCWKTEKICGNTCSAVGSFNMKQQLRKYFEKCFLFPLEFYCVLKNSLILLFWQIFGAYATHPFRFSDHYYGTGETFLYTFSPNFKVRWCSLPHVRFLDSTSETFMRQLYRDCIFGGSWEERLDLDNL